MSKEAETPISKYLAGLERKQSLLTPSPAPDPVAIIRKINFEDTYFHDQSVLHASPSPGPTIGQAAKRKRLSILGESLEDEENYDRKLSELERLLQKTQGELIEARALNTRLEHQICQIKSANMERIVGFEKSENEMKMKMRHNNDQVVLLKEQVHKLTKKEAELLEKLHKQTELQCDKVKSLEDKLGTLETENMELRRKFESGSLKQSDDLRKLNASLEETEMGAEKWVMESQLLRDKLELKDVQIQKYLNELKENQAIICKYNELKAKYPDPDGTSTTETLEEKLKYFENLYAKQQGENIKLAEKMEKVQEENKMLQSTINKEMLLEEQISAMEDDLKKMRSSLEEKAVLEADLGALKSELKSWTTMAFKLDPDLTNSTKFESYIRKLQNQLLEARHELSTLKLTISDRDRTIAKNQSEVSTLQEKLKTLTLEKENLKQDFLKASRRLVLVTKDRDGLKELKESYEQEFEGVISKPLQDRINQLEAVVAEYEAIIKEEPSNKKSCGDCEKRMALISEIRTEMDRLKSEKAGMETQIANMSMSMSTTTMDSSVDEGNSGGVKIVSFGNNPSILSLEKRLQEAIKENEDLKARIKELQERSSSGIDESSLSTGENLRELDEKNRSLERRLQLLSEAYDFETQQLQLIVNKLCGFHFTLVREPNVQIRLSSVYSHEQDDNFIFQESSNGDMLLLESPILDRFRDDIDRFLISDGSIPGFLSSVTITYVQQNLSSQNTSQLPPSQPSTAEEEESVRDPREVQVQVTRQRHPTASNDTDEEDEDDYAEDNEEHADDEAEDEEDVGTEGGSMEGDELEEEERSYEEEEDEEEDDDDEAEVQPPPRRGQIMRAPPLRPSAPIDSDDSDVIMIDDD